MSPDINDRNATIGVRMRFRLLFSLPLCFIFVRSRIPRTYLLPSRVDKVPIGRPYVAPISNRRIRVPGRIHDERYFRVSIRVKQITGRTKRILLSEYRTPFSFSLSPAPLRSVLPVTPLLHYSIFALIVARTRSSRPIRSTEAEEEMREWEGEEEGASRTPNAFSSKRSFPFVERSPALCLSLSLPRFGMYSRELQRRGVQKHLLPRTFAFSSNPFLARSASLVFFARLNLAASSLLVLSLVSFSFSVASFIVAI